MMGFANLHPFFVHAPLVLIPTAAAFMWLSRQREDFKSATLLLTLAASVTALAAMTSGFLTGGTFAPDAVTAELVGKHQVNGVVITAVVTLAALLALAEWRGVMGKRAWWLRVALLTWASVGVFFSGHGGAQLVYLHGAAVQRAR